MDGSGRMLREKAVGKACLWGMSNDFTHRKPSFGFPHDTATHCAIMLNSTSSISERFSKQQNLCFTLWLHRKLWVIGHENTYAKLIAQGITPKNFSLLKQLRNKLESYNWAFPEALTWTKQIKTKTKQENLCHTLPCLKAITLQIQTCRPGNSNVLFPESIFRASNRADIDSRLTFALPELFLKGKISRNKKPAIKGKLFVLKGTMNRPDSQKVLCSHPWKCGSHGAWQFGDLTLICNSVNAGCRSIAWTWVVAIMKKTKKTQIKTTKTMKMKKKKVIQWQKSLTTAWHKDNSEVSNLAMQKIEK